MGATIDVAFGAINYISSTFKTEKGKSNFRVLLQQQFHSHSQTSSKFCIKLYLAKLC